jgi:hypothetical protein
MRTAHGSAFRRRRLHLGVSARRRMEAAAACVRHLPADSGALPQPPSGHLSAGPKTSKSGVRLMHHHAAVSQQSCLVSKLHKQLVAGLAVDVDR